MGLEADLKAVRLKRANQLGQPAFCVFSNKTLAELVQRCPSTESELLAVNGIGKQKVQQFGAPILEVCRRYSKVRTSVTSGAPDVSTAAKREEAPRKRPREDNAGVQAVIADVQNTGLYQELSAFRAHNASMLNQPTYCVFGNQTLADITVMCPASEAELLGVKGVGTLKLEKFGKDVLTICNKWRDAHQQQGWGKHATLPLKLTSQFSDDASEHSLRNTEKRQAIFTGAPTMPATPEIKAESLTEEQLSAANFILRGNNCFLSGPAGTGKSFLLTYVVQQLRKKYPEEGQVVVTAPTGAAAANVEGSTIHSFAGIGLGAASKEALVERVRKSEKACHRWSRLKVLVIDEVSMLDSHLFSAVELIARELCGCGAPFGGVHLITVGDFFQLPPVELGNYHKTFPFLAAAWHRCRLAKVVLQQVVRQRGDAEFIRMLNEVRQGLCSAHTAAMLARCHVNAKPRPADGIEATRIYCINRDVDKENQTRLHALPGPTTAYHATDIAKGSGSDAVRKAKELLDKKVGALLELKPGAQVILVRNYSEYNLVNGSRGRVLSAPAGGDPLVQFDNGVTMKVRPESFFQSGGGGVGVSRTQLPLKLGWALTVHKAQGLTLSRAELQMHNAFDYGQTYVALSRVSSIAGLWISGGQITQHTIKAHPDVIAYYNQP